jgi:hypothetical protein
MDMIGLSRCGADRQRGPVREWFEDRFFPVVGWVISTNRHWFPDSRDAIIASLRAELDAGYRVLLDRDGLTNILKPPTYRAYIPVPPSESEYVEMIELALLEAAYVARYLWRDDLMGAKFCGVPYVKLSASCV